jgi:hypothetical protein
LGQALKLRPGLLRARVSGDYRLMFRAGEALVLVDCIHRRGLERWLA